MIAVRSDPCPPGDEARLTYRGFARIYDRLVGDAAFPAIRRSFELAVRGYGIPFSSAADIGCGTGTFLRYLQAYGVPLVGVDRSEDMLRVAARKNRGGGILFLRQDVTGLRLPAPVDLITCNFDTLNYLLSPGDLEKAFARCRRNLNENGHFLFDVITGGRYGRGPRRRIQKVMTDGMRSTWFFRWDPKSRLSRVRMRHLATDRSGGSRKVAETHVQRWYPLVLVNRLLSGSGFAIRGIQDVETSCPATDNTFWAKYIAMRN